MTYHALISPQGCTEYNALFVVGEGVKKLVPGQWYTPQELADLCGGAVFLRENPGTKEKGVRRWRYEVQV